MSAARANDDYDYVDPDLVSPSIGEPDDVEYDVYDIERKHVLLFLGGLALVGLTVFIGWEYMRHRFAKSRVEAITGHIATAVRYGAMGLREFNRINVGLDPQEAFEADHIIVEEF